MGAMAANRQEALVTGKSIFILLSLRPAGTRARFMVDPRPPIEQPKKKNLFWKVFPAVLELLLDAREGGILHLLKRKPVRFKRPVGPEHI